VPELPEVETVRRGLLPVMEGRRILRAEVNRPDLRWPLPERMAERLAGRRVTALRRRSKYILADLDGADVSRADVSGADLDGADESGADLDGGETLLIHLGMSGRMLIAEAQVGVFHHALPAAEKHDHVVLTMEGGARITFNDARRFGMMDLWPTADLAAHPLLAGLGPEPFGNDFNETYLAERLRGRTMPVKAALLDQRIVAGLGNIYVCEALHDALISPERRVRDMTEAEIARLVPVIRDVLTRAIDAGGSSLRDYRQADGELGYFQHSFRVYGREGLPCLHPGCGGTVRRVVQSGRSSFFCPVCQR